MENIEIKRESVGIQIDVGSAGYYKPVADGDNAIGWERSNPRLPAVPSILIPNVDKAGEAAEAANAAAEAANTAAAAANTATDNANTKAALADEKATAAQNAANAANDAAANADAKAALADEKATAAQTAATAAEDATAIANNATANANAATQAANSAADNANSKATLADEKATLAQNAATNADEKAALADEKATAASTAAEAANTAAENADAAAENANTKAALAQEKADAANTAAAGANTAAGNANTAATAANDAAAGATTATSNANTAISAANSAAAGANTATANANAATANANEAAQTADEAAMNAETARLGIQEDLNKKAPAIQSEATGAVVSVDDAGEAPAVGLISYIEPVQTGSGDPSPDNIRPITGHDACKAWTAGDDVSNPVTYEAALPQTVYGGSYDHVTGKLTVDRALVTLDGTEEKVTRTSSWSNSYAWRISNVLANAKVYDSGTNANLRCNYAKSMTVSALAYTAGMIGVGAHYGDVVLCIGEYDTEQALRDFFSAQYAAGTPVQVCYELASPQTYDLTPQQVDMLKGLNNAWSDTGDTKLMYVRDTEMIIDAINAKTPFYINDNFELCMEVAG